MIANSTQLVPAIVLVVGFGLILGTLLFLGLMYGDSYGEPPKDADQPDPPDSPQKDGE